MKKNKILSKPFYKRIYIVLGIILIIFALYNLSQIFSFNTIFDEKLAEAKEAARPANTQLVIISTPSCKDCYNINTVVDFIESTGVNITSKREVEFSSQEAKLLIDKYDIEKVPTVIITGEINKSKSLNSKLKQIGEEKEGAYIFTKLEPPFIDAATNKVRGKINLIYLKKEDCKECFNLTSFINQLIESGLKFGERKTIDIDSIEGKDIINRYNITKVPTIIMNKEAEVYTNIMNNWGQIGSIENDGYLVMRATNLPYYSIEEKRVKGLISVTFLIDDSCKNCYDPNKFHKPILQQWVSYFKEEKVNVSSTKGQLLINKYNIEKVPTIILEGDVEEYPVLVNAWKDVGTKESDGTYVFRKVEIAKQTYKNLTTGKIIEVG